MPQTDYSGIASSAKLNGTLSASAGPGTVITVDTAAGWPTGATGIPFVGTFGRGTSSEEKVLFSLRSGNNLTISQRGYDDTVAADHGNGEPLLHTTDATILRTASAHIYDNTRNDHAQYARKAFVNTFTAAQTIANTDNGVALKVNSAAGQTSDLLQVVNNNALRLKVAADGTSTLAGDLSATGADHYFGADALSGGGSRIHLGSLGDPNNAFITAEGSGTNTGLILRTQGTGDFTFQTATGTEWGRIKVLNNAGETNFVVNANGIGMTALKFGAAGTGPGGSGRAIYI